MSQQTQGLDGGRNLILNRQSFQNDIQSLQQIPLIAVSNKSGDLINSQSLSGQPHQAIISNTNGIIKDNYQLHSSYQGQRNYLFSSLSQQDSPSHSVKRQQQYGTVDNTIVNNNSMIADSIKKQKLSQTASTVDLPRIPSPSSTNISHQQQVNFQNNSLALSQIGSQGRMPSFSPERKNNNNVSKSHFHFSSSSGLTLKLQMAQSRQSFRTRQVLPSQSHFNVSNLLQPTQDNIQSKNLIANLNNSSSMQKQSFSSKYIRLSESTMNKNNNTSLSNAERTPKTTDSVVLRNSVVGSENTIKIFDKTKQTQKQSTGKIHENESNKDIIALSAEEKDQLQAIKRGGISSFVRAIQSNSEYIFRSEIEKERIFIEKILSKRKDEDESHGSSQQLPQKQFDTDDGLFTDTNRNQMSSNTENASTVLEQNVRDLKKINEQILCEIIGSKRLSSNAQIQAVQSTLLETLQKCIQLIHHEYLENMLIEVIQGLLFLSNKKHMVVESQKRDEMLSILQGITANEANWGIQLFGSEESVEKFRFKMGEIALENVKLTAEIEKVRQESKAMSVQLEKEKKANQLLSSHCQIAQSIQRKLAQKLEWKYESYVRRFNRANNNISKEEEYLMSQKHPQQPRQSVLFAHSRNKSTNEKTTEIQNTPKNHGSTRPSKISNLNNLSAPPKADLKFQRLSNILSPNRSTPSHFQGHQDHLGLSFAEQIALLHEEDLFETNQKHHNQDHPRNDHKKKLSQLPQEISSPSSFSSSFGDVDKILMEASKITKIDNNEVVIKEIHEDIPVFFFNQETQTDSKITEWHLTTGVSIQTDLHLVEKQFDHIMNNDRLEKLSKQEEIKEQLQNYLSDESEESECQSSIHSLDSFESDKRADKNRKNIIRDDDVIKDNKEFKSKILEKNDSINCNSEEDSRKKKIPAVNPQKEIDKKFKKRISVVQILKGLPLEKRKKQIEKNDIDALADNIHLLQNFLQSSPSASDTSILVDPMEDTKQTGTAIISPKTKFTPKQGILPIAKKTESNSNKGIKNITNANKLTIPNNINYKNIRASVQKIPSSELIPNTAKNNIVISIPTSTKIGKNFGIYRGSGKQGEPSLKAIPSSSFIEADKKTLSNLNELNLKKSSKFFEQESKEELRSQILSIVKLYNLETEKSKNYEESIEQIFKIMQELFGFCYKIFTHIQRTQKDTYKSVVEQFFQAFTAIRWKLPSEIDQKLEEDLYPEEILEKKLAAKKKLLKKTLANPSKTPGGFFLANLRGATKLTVQDKSVHPGIVLTKKLREAGLPKKFNGYLPLKAILRQITQIYEERARQVAENRLTPDTELCIFVFNRFLHQYGFKNVAEQKYLHFLMNVLNYQQIFRVQIFARAVGVLFMDEENYEIDEMDKFLSGWYFVTSQSTLGQNIPYGEADTRIFCHYLRCYDYLRARMEKILHPQQVIELRQFIEQSRESEYKTSNTNQNQTNKNNLIDVDTFFARVLTEYRYVMNETKISVKNAFLACDLDGNGTININEFHTLFRHLEPDRFTLGKACKIFESSADIITAESKCLSFQRFTSLCLQDRLFSENSQRKFLGIYEKYEVDPLFVELKKTWTAEKQFISDSIDQLKPYVQVETFKQWKENLLVLNDRIQNNTNSTVNSTQNNKNNSTNNGQLQGMIMKQFTMEDTQNPTVTQLQSEYFSNVMPILIAHKMLKQELARLLDVTHTEEDLNFHDVDLDELENDDEYDKELDNDVVNNNMALEQQLQAQQQQQLVLEQQQSFSTNQDNKQQNMSISNNKNVSLFIQNNLGDDQKSKNSGRSYNQTNGSNINNPGLLHSNLQFLGFPQNISPSQKLLGLKQHLAEGNSLEIIDAQIYQFSDEQVVKETQPNAKKKTLALQKIQNAANVNSQGQGLLPKKY